MLLQTTSRIGNVAYALSMIACLAPLVAILAPLELLTTELTVRHFFPMITLSVAATAIAVLQSRMKTRTSILLSGSMGAGVILSCVLLTTSVLTEFRTTSIFEEVVPIVVAVLLGLLHCVPELKLAGDRARGAKSHDDTDRAIVRSGLWVMAWPFLITLVVTIFERGDLSGMTKALEIAEMIVLNIGAAIVAFGFGRSALRRQWIKRAKRGEIEGVRVRVLAEAERPPNVLPMTRIAIGEEIHVIEVVTRPAQSAYRNAEFVQPIALVARQ